MVEEYKEGPVDQPRPLLQSLHVVGGCSSSTIINELSQLRQVIKCTIPVLNKNLTSQFAPKNWQVILKNKDY